MYLLLCSSSVIAQEKESTDIHKTKSSATIGGVKYYLHTVEKGQTLFAIAKFYKIEVNDLVIENPEAIDGIKPGQVLRIPVEKKVVVKQEQGVDTSNCIIHTVEKGQTLYSITKQYGVTDEVLKKLNPELLNGLKTGQKIKIPSNKPKTEIAVVTPVTNKEVVEEKAKEKTIDQSTTIPKLEAVVDKGTGTAEKYNGELKDEYNIAFFLPFHADESNAIEIEKLVKGEEHFSNKTKVALEFYEGAKLAIDSLKKEKLNAKIFVYDVDDKDSLGVLNLLKKPELASMDLIIGPLYGSSFMPVAKFAKENEIPIVSPFTQVNKILFENPYVCKVSPSVTL
ncbi:MAG: LysM peptidoglycan-binding domain-containing protein, partial [Bacteroidia bacterium]|nr:LysM peptidoglycan-binding domain-containing protein [Bacteroidia bacterium]